MQKEEMEQVYQQHARTVYGFLLLRTQDSQLAEELTQETFYQALRSLNKYDGSCQIATWLCAIAKNVLYKYRHKNKKTSLPLEEAGEAPSRDINSESIVLAEENVMELMHRLHRLPEKMREVIYLRLAADLSFRQIGEIMGQSETWARVTYYRGKEKLLKEGEE